MQERNFERQVKDRLEEFNLPPSAPVWQKIEREIRRKRERRRLILWLLPFLLAGGALLFWTNTKEEATTTSRAQNAPAKSNSSNQGSITTTTPPAGKEEGTASAPASSLEKTPVTSEQTQQQFSKEIVAVQKKQKRSAAHVNRVQSTTTATKNNRSLTPLSTTPNEPVIKTGQVLATETTAGRTEEKQEPAKTDTAKKIEAEAKPAADPASEPAGSKEQKKDDKKWKIALHASAGYAESAESFFPLSGPGEPLVVPNSIGPMPVQTPAPLRKGLYAAAGLQFTKSISSRVSFSTGIQYSYGSTVQQVGNRRMRDSATTPFAASSETYTYENGRVNKYTNHYHFLEIPAGVDMQLFSALPIELHAGFSISGLIASNALHFDEATNTYYRNSDLLRRTGVNWYSGFSYGLMKNRLKIGPHLQYGVLSLNTNEKAEKNYLLLAGIRAKWMLK